MRLLTGAKRREWMGMGVAGMIITSDYGSFPHSLLSTSKFSIFFKHTTTCGLMKSPAPEQGSVLGSRIPRRRGFGPPTKEPTNQPTQYPNSNKANSLNNTNSVNNSVNKRSTRDQQEINKRSTTHQLDVKKNQ